MSVLSFYFIILIFASYSLQSTDYTCLSTSEAQCIYNIELGDYDYLQYVTWWMPTVNSTYPPYIKTLTLHGVWPGYWNNSYPCYCSEIPFNFTDIHNLYPQLEVAWYDPSGPKSTNLWSHEWSKHGVCMTTNQYEFFEQGINLHSIYNFMEILANSSIIPTLNYTYTYDTIYDAIYNAHDAVPLVDCTITSESGLGKIVALYRIIYCMDNSYGLINCPECIVWQHQESSECNNEIYFLPLTPTDIYINEN